MKKNYKRQFTLLAKCVLFIFIFQCFTLSDLFAEDNNTFAESVHKVKIDLNMRSGSVNEVFAMIERNTYFRFAFDKKDINNAAQVFLPQGQLTVAEILQEVAKNSALNFKQINNTIYVKKLSKKASQNEIEVIIEEGKASDTHQKEDTYRQAEDVRVSGKVTSQDDGQPMPGVNISVKGEARGTVTDVNGDYSVTVPEDAVLVFSFMGYVTEEIMVNSRAVIDLVLVQDISQLDEIVVIGYGETKRRDLTGSVASIKSDEIMLAPTHNALEAIKGRVPGMDITRRSGRAGEEVDINIRGNRSIHGDNGPLYIIDGFQGGSINNLNPNDIESIEVLKDASATAIYGSQGANGVIIVTTKKGTAGKMKVSYNGFFGVNGMAQWPKMRTGDDYIQLRREAWRTTGDWNSPADDPNIFVNDGEWSALENGQWIDWTDHLIKNGTQNSHSISVSGGNEKTKAFFSGGYFKEEGMLSNDNMTRYTARWNIEHKINNWIKTGLLGQVAYFDQNYRRSPLNYAMGMSPFGQLYDETGNYSLFPVPANGNYSPLADERGSHIFQDNGIRTNVMANGFVEITPIEGLKIRSNLGTNLTSSRRGRFESTESFAKRGNPVASTELEGLQSRFYNWDNIITYTKNFGDHSFTLTGITNYIERTEDRMWMTGMGQALSLHSFYNIGSTDVEGRDIGSSYVRHNMMSYAGRVNYSYKGKYILTATQRYDGASRLSPSNRWDAFPSVAGSWIASDEDFMMNIPQISLLKLRASYGIAGNSGIGPYGTQALVVPSNRMTFGEAGVLMYRFGDYAQNVNLGWEKSATTNLGFDLGFFNDRVTATVDLYNTNTTGLLYERNLPPSSGVAKVWENIAETNNRGVEINITSRNIQKNNFTWTTSANLTRNVEKIVSLPGGEDLIRTENNSLLIGYPVNTFYSYRKLGIWQLHEADQASNIRFGSETGTPFQPGDIKVEDVNGDGVIDAEDRQFLGSTVPAFVLGLQNNFRYKNWDLGFFLFARWGQMIDAQFMGRYNPSGEGNGPAFMDYWTPENPTNDFPRPERGANFSSLRGGQSLRYIDGSFIKLQNIQVGYNVPKSVSNKIKVENLRIYATGNNLFTYSKSHLLREYDPERGGEDTFPLLRQVIMGVTIDF